MNCNYKVGDALLSITMWLALLGLLSVAAIEHHWGWWIPDGILFLTFVGGCVLNQKERNREKVQAIRIQRQLALGVPPDEPV